MSNGESRMVHIEIDTTDGDLVFDLMGRPKSVGRGTSVEVPGDARLEVEGILKRKAFGIPETLELALTLGSGVATGVVANWLWAKLNGRASRLRIERTEIELDEGVIRRVLHEKIDETR